MLFDVGRNAEAGLLEQLSKFFPPCPQLSRDVNSFNLLASFESDKRQSYRGAIQPGFI